MKGQYIFLVLKKERKNRKQITEIDYLYVISGNGLK